MASSDDRTPTGPCSLASLIGHQQMQEVLKREAGRVLGGTYPHLIDEVRQEVSLKIISRPGILANNPAKLLAAMARRKSLNFLRSVRAQKTSEMPDELSDSSFDPERMLTKGTLIDEDAQAALKALLERLAKVGGRGDRLVTILNLALRGVSQKGIAAIVHRSPSTISEDMTEIKAVARELLREISEEDSDPPPDGGGGHSARRKRGGGAFVTAKPNAPTRVVTKKGVEKLLRILDSLPAFSATKPDEQPTQNESNVATSAEIRSGLRKLLDTLESLPAADVVIEATDGLTGRIVRGPGGDEQFGETTSPSHYSGLHEAPLASGLSGGSVVHHDIGSAIIIRSEVVFGDSTVPELPLVPSRVPLDLDLRTRSLPGTFNHLRCGYMWRKSIGQGSRASPTTHSAQSWARVVDGYWYGALTDMKSINPRSSLLMYGCFSFALFTLVADLVVWSNVVVGLVCDLTRAREDSCAEISRYGGHTAASLFRTGRPTLVAALEARSKLGLGAPGLVCDLTREDSCAEISRYGGHTAASRMSPFPKSVGISAMVSSNMERELV